VHFYAELGGGYVADQGVETATNGAKESGRVIAIKKGRPLPRELG